MVTLSLIVTPVVTFLSHINTNIYMNFVLFCVSSHLEYSQRRIDGSILGIVGKPLTKSYVHQRLYEIMIYEAEDIEFQNILPKLIYIFCTLI